MDQLRRALQAIGSQLSRLTLTHKLLVAAVCVIALMTLFLVTQYAGTADVVELLPGVDSAEQKRVAGYLDSSGTAYTLSTTGAVMVPQSRRHIVQAQLARAQQMPGDTSVMFRNIAEKQNWMMPKSQLDQLYQQAVMNELRAIITNIPGIADARVIIDAPAPRGMGASVRRPTAQVTVFTDPGYAMEQSLVDSIALMVSGSTAGLDPASVRIIDGAKRRWYRSRPEGAVDGSTYLEQVSKIEQRVQEKIEASLSFIDGVIVSVNAAQVEVGQSQTTRTRVLPKGDGSESLISRENSQTSNSTQSTPGAEPGVRSNVPMDINRGGGDRSVTTQETSESQFETEFGREETTTLDPKGRPTRIFVSVSVPRDWVARLVRQRRLVTAGAAPAAEPTEDEINAAWPAEQQRLKDLLSPLVETTAEAGVRTDSVVVSLIPVALPLAGLAPGIGSGDGPAPSPGGGGAGFGGVSSLAAGGLIRTALLGGLAVLAMGMMAVMVRKSTRPLRLPTAEELVGVPPALSVGADLVGEAIEGETAMAGIEIDDDSLKTKKMLEQVSQLVKKNPKDAATLFNRWLTTET
ncbi:MAG TPA: flagellar M-ring protein FliF C-terminal domain-containing protein [Phycisphaerales bacterium]|nr:flagellar M-ring protein FliF C-terminal domain-containing protein [Phycisphaerales bacterium]